MAVYTISSSYADGSLLPGRSFVCVDDGDALTLARTNLRLGAHAEVRLGTRLVGRVFTPAKRTVLDMFIAQNALSAVVLGATATNDNQADRAIRHAAATILEANNVVMRDALARSRTITRDSDSAI